MPHLTASATGAGRVARRGWGLCSAVPDHAAAAAHALAQPAGHRGTAPRRQAEAEEEAAHPQTTPAQGCPGDAGGFQEGRCRILLQASAHGLPSTISSPRQWQFTALQLSRARTDRKPKAALGKQRILAQAAMPTDRMAGRWARLSRLGAATQAEALAPTTDQEIPGNSSMAAAQRQATAALTSNRGAAVWWGPPGRKELGLPGACWWVQAVWHATDIQEAMPSSA